MIRRSCTRSALPLAALLVMSACDMDFSAVFELTSNRLIRVNVWPTDEVLEVGDSVRLSATGDVGGALGMFMYDLVRDAEWSLSGDGSVRLEPVPLPPTTDSITPTQVLVRAVRPGTATVIATARGIAGTTSARVIPPIAAIVLEPVRDTVRVGDTLWVEAYALDGDRRRIGELPLGFAAQGSVQVYYSYPLRGMYVVATAPGEGTVRAFFHRRQGEARVVVRQD